MEKCKLNRRRCRDGSKSRAAEIERSGCAEPVGGERGVAGSFSGQSAGGTGESATVGDGVGEEEGPKAQQGADDRGADPRAEEKRGIAVALIHSSRLRS